MTTSRPLVSICMMRAEKHEHNLTQLPRCTLFTESSGRAHATAPRIITMGAVLFAVGCAGNRAPPSEMAEPDAIAEPAPVETVPDMIEMGGAKSVTTFFITSV